MSRRQQILESWKTRLETTGRAVYLGEVVELGEDDPQEVIAIIPGDDQPGRQGHKILITLPITLQLLAKADLDEPWAAVEALLVAVKTAVETPDHRLNSTLPGEIERGATRTIPREPGTTAVGAVLTYYVPYAETWGAP